MHACNLEKKSFAFLTFSTTLLFMVTVSLPWSFFLGWKKFLSSSSSSSRYSFCPSSDLQKPFHRELREGERLLETRSVYIGRGKRLPGLFMGFKGRVKVRWICKFYCLPPRLRSSSSPIRIGTLMVNFENVVASTKNLKESRNILLLIFISNIKLGLSNTNRNEIEL